MALKHFDVVSTTQAVEKSKLYSPIGVTQKTLDLDRTVENIIDTFNGSPTAPSTSQLVQSATVTLTAAQINALDTAPLLMLPALPSGQAYTVLAVTSKTSAGTDATIQNGGCYIYLNYGNAAGNPRYGARAWSNPVFVASSITEWYKGSPTVLTNDALYLAMQYNTSSYYTIASATITCTITIYYIISPI